MSASESSMAASIRELVPSARLRSLLTLALDISEVIKVGSPGTGLVIGLVAGGNFDGRLSGRVLGGGSDWQRMNPDGSLHLDCRVVLETAQNQLIAMTYRGIRAGPEEVLARLAANEPVTADEYYLRVDVSFETGASELSWLNRIIAVGTGYRRPTGPVYDIFELL